MSEAFENSVALVTGGGTGIGAATALRLAEAGCHVVITGRSEAALRASAAQHKNLRYVVADVSNPEHAANVINELRTRHGRLDVLVNNAGVAEVVPLGDATAEHVRRIFDINVDGLIETTRLALPLLKQSQGTIINLASLVADRPFANMSVYSASKAAVLALTRAWAKELAKDGIRVNAVSPGPIETPMFATDKLKISAAQLEQFGASVLPLVPMNRFGKPDEIAQAIVFLASAAASYITGAQYTVGGGMEA